MIEVIKTKNGLVQYSYVKQELVLQMSSPMIIDQDMQLLTSDVRGKSSKLLEKINEEINEEKIEIVISAPSSFRAASEESIQECNFNLSSLDQHIECSARNLIKEIRCPSYLSDPVTRETNISPGAQLNGVALQTDDQPLSEQLSNDRPNFSISSLESQPVMNQTSPTKTINSYYCDTTISIGSVDLDFDKLDFKIKQNYQFYKKLQNYQIPESVLIRFSQDYNASQTFTMNLFSEYKRYLFVLKVSEGIQKLECSRLIRTTWNYHIAHSLNYQQFCQELYGEFIDTSPLPRLIGLQVKRNYVRTLVTYRRIFGEVCDSRIWPSVDQCFNQEVNYSLKLFNIQGYIDQAIQHFLKTNSKQSNFSPKKRQSKYEPQWKLIQESKRALAHMLVCRKPERGKFHLKRESRSGGFFDQLESYASFS